MINEVLKIFDQPAYALFQKEKDTVFLAALKALVQHHRLKCPSYEAILAVQGYHSSDSVTDLPFLPVRIFKEHLLESIPETRRFKMMTSSGTTGKSVSQISLDRLTAQYQTKAMVMLMQDFLGRHRLPMLIVDHPGVIRDRHNFSARGTGILGMSNFGRGHTYALFDETMEINLAGVIDFLKKWGNAPILLFGFTFMVWKFLIQSLEASGDRLSIPNGILVHSGGWKKLQDEAVGSDEFKDRLAHVTGIRRVHNFYGMVEQTGSIYVECEYGRLHVSTFSEIIIRRPHDWSEAEMGEEGLIQTLSCLPYSYPGHSLLTEDLGCLTGQDDCPCGRQGRTFSVSGRLPKSEVRGCSDTFDEHARVLR